MLGVEMNEYYDLHGHHSHEVVLSVVKRLRAGNAISLQAGQHIWNVAILKKEGIYNLKKITPIEDWCILADDLKNVSQWIAINKASYRTIHKLRKDAYLFWVSPNGLFKRLIKVRGLLRIGLYFCHDNITTRLFNEIEEPLIMTVVKASENYDCMGYNAFSELDLIDEKVE